MLRALQTQGPLALSTQFLALSLSLPLALANGNYGSSLSVSPLSFFHAGYEGSRRMLPSGFFAQSLFLSLSLCLALSLSLSLFIRG